MTEWRDRHLWAQASVVPPVLMIFIGAVLWPVGILPLAFGVYLVLVIQKARREMNR